MSTQPFDPTTPFVEREGYAWCVGCHTNRFSPKCKQCRKPVTGTVLRALGAEWHEACFCCVVRLHLALAFLFLRRSFEFQILALGRLVAVSCPSLEKLRGTC